MKVIAAVPVRNNIKWTAPMIEGLLLGDEVDEVWVYDNGSSDLTAQWVANRSVLDSRLMYMDASDMRIYDMWSHMIKRAAEIGGVRLAILNNDIRLPFRALRTMAEMMDGYQLACIDKDRTSFQGVDPSPRPVDAWWAERTGWAFMVNADFWKGEAMPIHPDFKIWWGDDDLFRRTQMRGGKICRMIGIGCDHTEQSSNSEYQGDKWVDVEQDRLKFIEIWGS